VEKLHPKFTNISEIFMIRVLERVDNKSRVASLFHLLFLYYNTLRKLLFRQLGYLLARSFAPLRNLRVALSELSFLILSKNPIFIYHKFPYFFKRRRKLTG